MYKRKQSVKKTYSNYTIECTYERFNGTYINQYHITYSGDHLPRETKLKEEFLYLEESWWNIPDNTRDTQKQKVYDAEKVAWAKIGKTKFKDHMQASRFIAKVISNKWFVDNFHIRKMSMRHDHRNHVSARGGGKYNWHSRDGKIIIPDWALSDYVILHEIAHCCQQFRPGHGRNFCFIYLQLVRKFVGKEAAAEIELQFKKNGVQYWIYGTREPHIQENLETLMNKRNESYCPF